MSYAFKLKNPDYYLNMGTPPCSHCECTQSIKLGLKPCPYLDSPFYIKVNKCKVAELKATPYNFIDFPYIYIINSTFERIDVDDTTFELLIK